MPVPYKQLYISSLAKFYFLKRLIRVRAQRYKYFCNYKNCYIFAMKKNKLLLCPSTNNQLITRYG